MSKPPQSWLPNLVGGVSIWKLAGDLNDPKHFDGRLLEPETEGSDSLPTKVSWDLTGMIPLSEARHKHPEDAERAVGEFVACLKRVSAKLDDESSGYHKFKEAFTVPGLDADDGAHYHYHPANKKLYVINWGASPRTLRQEQNFLFGYGSFDDLYDGDVPDDVPAAAGGSGGAGQDEAAGAAVAAPGAAATDGDAAEDADEKKEDDEDEKKEDDEDEESEGKPWWFWVLIGLLAIALIVAALLLLDQCQDPSTDAGGSSGSGAAASGGAGGATATNTAPGGGGGAGDKAGEGGAGGGHGGAGGGEGGAGGGQGAGGGDGGGSGDGEGGSSGDPGDFEAPVAVVPTGSGGGGGKVIVINPGGGTPSQSAPHRVHFHPQARRWRIAKGHQHVALVEAGDGKYDVYLKPGRSFRDVKVQWQDRGGVWHDH
ncbi:MAG TPA: hypothetical protein ENK57_20180 [Polyangiaceae bacterium]|nr:hypothetical protein [Polyangiaceae bacterium]